MKLTNLVKNLTSATGKENARSNSVKSKEHESVGGSTGENNNAIRRDSVNIAGAHELESLTAQTLAEKPSNESIEELKASIRDGSYKPDLNRLAEQLLVKTDIADHLLK